MKIFRPLLLFLLPVWLIAGEGRAEDRLVFADAWIRAMPAGMGMTAAFGRLTNTGATELELVSFSSPSFGSVSLHRSERVDGVSRMREVDSLRLDAGQTLELAPGGYHLMLMSPTASIAPGEEVPVEMTGAGGERFRFRVPVERR